jgi:two-component system CheB/CheR fusion protein
MEEMNPQAEKEQPAESQTESAQEAPPQDNEAEAQAAETSQEQPEEATPEVGGTEPGPHSAKEDTPSLIVGIGASAGGLEAMGDFFSQMPAQSGLAFVVVMHLEPTYESMLDRVLQRYTPMKVVRIKDSMPVRPNQVYVIPQNQDLGIMRGTLHLMRKIQGEEQQLVIDSFLRHLAQDQGPRAACLILSGNGADGSLGLRMIKEKGGLVIVQEPETASYNRMPQNAIRGHH